MGSEDKLRSCKEYREKLLLYRRRPDPDLRSFISQNTMAVRREVLEADCYHGNGWSTSGYWWSRP